MHPTGSVYAGLTIYDAMQFVRPEIQTTCVGVAMSMGALLLAAGTRGKRAALPNMERDYFLAAEEARQYGIIDRVITHR